MPRIIITVTNHIPVPQPRPRLGKKRAYSNNDRVSAWKEAVAWSAVAALSRAGCDPAPKGTEVTVAARFRTPRATGDWDNLAKGVFDAIQGIVYVDDRQIVEAHIRVERGVKKKEAGVVITVEWKEETK